MIFLEFGVNSSGEYTHISQTPSGRTTLVCPYCATPLLAKKGQQLTHHFAHDGETCRDSDRDFDALTVPVYDRFHLYLPGQVWSDLQEFHKGIRTARTLWDHDLVREGYGRRRTIELTHKGKIPFGLATLSKFEDFQMGEIYGRHGKLEETYLRAAMGAPHMTSRFNKDGYRRPSAWDKYPPRPELATTALADLNIFRAQVARVFSLTLYLLEIEHSGGTLHKIGVTGRGIEERIREIERDLKPHLEIKGIEAVRLLKHRGSIERYAQHRYREYSHTIGNFTEYFEFDTKTLRGVKSDFTRLGDMWLPQGDERHRYNNPERQLTGRGLISEIVSNDKPLAQRHVEAEHERARLEQERAHAQEEHRQATIRGMEAARESGKHLGRPKGTGATRSDIISKYPQVVLLLEAGTSIRETARTTGISPTTVQRVKRAMNE